MVRGGVSFDSLAARYSDDAGSKDKGGEYEFMLAQKSSLAPEFGDYVFEQGHAGESKVVKTELGYHFIEILRQGQPEASTKIAFISKELNMSEASQSAVYTKATQFASQSGNGAAFDKTAKAKGYMATPSGGLNKNSYVVNGLGSSRELVKWAYDAKLGDVSPVFNVNDKYIVAKLSNIMDIGLAPINAQTRPILEGYVKKEKKAKLLMERTKGKGSLDAIAQAENQQVSIADSVNFLQGFVPGVGNEPKVAGYAFFKSFKQNTVSPAIAGQEAVYYINLQSRSDNQAGQPRNLPIERQMLEYNIKGAAANMVMTGLRENADVKDTRGEIY